MENLIEPNIHPILVHFAYALSLSALGVYILGRVLRAGPKRESTQVAGDWMLVLGALAIVATIAAGFQAYYSVAHDGPSHAAMTTHRNWAVPSGIAIIALATWRYMKRAKAPNGLFISLLAVAALSLSVTAWWGGNVVYNYGLGVSSLPVVTGDGHDHDHGEPEASQPASAGHDNSDGHHASDDNPAEKALDNSDGHHDTSDNAVATPRADLSDPAGAVTAFHAAMSIGDTEGMKTMLASDVIISESGGAERSFEEYAGHHMPADIAFTKAVSTTLKKRDVIESGDMATVMSESQIHGTFKDKKIHNSMMETMVLRREDVGWKIVHIHWSSTPIKGEHEH